MRLAMQLVRLVLVSLTYAAGSLVCANAQAPLVCMPRFAQQAGVRNSWMGADAAYSVRLSRQRDAWIFGDTLLGPKRAMKDGEPFMTHNSLGISHCERGTEWDIRYLTPQDAHGVARGVFVPRDPSHWYWPMDGFVFDHKLWIELLCLRQPQPPRPGVFNFESCGVDLANLPISDQMTATQVMVQPLTAASVGASMSSTAVTHGKFVYFFGIRESRDRALLLSRVRLSHLAKAARWLEFLAGDGHWQRDEVPKEAKVLWQPGATEMSVRYHPEWHAWMAVYKDPDMMSDQVLLRLAPALTGPWSAARSLFSIRTLDPAASRPGIFCYAAKEHPEFARRGELVVTYVCNASDPAALLTQNDVYLPQVVRVRLGENLQVLDATRVPEPTQDRSALSPGQTEAAPR